MAYPEKVPGLQPIPHKPWTNNKQRWSFYLQLHEPLDNARNYSLAEEAKSDRPSPSNENHGVRRTRPLMSICRQNSSHRSRDFVSSQLKTGCEKEDGVLWTDGPKIDPPMQRSAYVLYIRFLLLNFPLNLCTMTPTRRLNCTFDALIT